MLKIMFIARGLDTFDLTVDEKLKLIISIAESIEKGHLEDRIAINRKLLNEYQKRVNVHRVSLHLDETIEKLSFVDIFLSFMQILLEQDIKDML